MLQVVQNYRTGSVEVLDVPPPALRPGGVIVRLCASLISTGTERGKVALARKSLLAKARERPDAVRLVLQSLRREGVASTYRRVLHRLDRLTPIGYSAAGVVEEAGKGVRVFRTGDRVAVGGAGYASHAELVWVPQNLVARIPAKVSFDAASFATIGSIALHAFRLAGTSVGETVVVIGLGLIGQLAVRIARAAGCRVLGCDLFEPRVALAAAAGAIAATPDGFAQLVHQKTGGLGADAVVLAAASASSGPVRLAAEVARERAKVVAVGALRLDIPRDAFYRKELSLVVSRSYGPGRYDPSYEEKGIDYPASYVRWTEGRNLEAVLGLMADGALDVGPLVSRRFGLAEAGLAYEALLGEDPSVLGIVLGYTDTASTSPGSHSSQQVRKPPVARGQRQTLRIGLVGAGSFASNVLVPALRSTGAVRLVSVASASGLSAQDAVRKLGFERAVRDGTAVIDDPEVDAVVIATPHHLHAALVVAAVEAGKAVFVEKPLAISWEQLDAVRAVAESGVPLMVGFNRRFSPHVQRLTSLTCRRNGALVCAIRVNAGAIPPDSWMHDVDVGGGRLIGEGCHFVDLACHIVGAPPSKIQCIGVSGPDSDVSLGDNVIVALEFPDGSISSVAYTAKGDSASGKERVEVFCDGWSGVIDNFDMTTITQDGRAKRWRGRGEKGHREEVAAFVAAVIRGDAVPIPVTEFLASSAATLAAGDSLARGGEAVEVPQ